MYSKLKKKILHLKKINRLRQAYKILYTMVYMNL